jgi:hypothetical protein
MRIARAFGRKIGSDRFDAGIGQIACWLTGLDFSDFSVIALIVILFAGGGAACTSLLATDAGRLARLERKLDAVMRHLDIAYVDPAGPEGLSEEVRRLADDPGRKIQAIKLHREQT